MGKLLFVGLFVFVLNGCIGVVEQYPEPPPLAAVEMTLTDVDDQCVRRLVENGLMTLGWQIRTSDNARITGARQSQDSVANILFRTPTSAPEERLTAYFEPQDNPRNVRILFVRQFVSNPGTINEKSRTKIWTQGQQATVMGLQPKFESSCSK